MATVVPTEHTNHVVPPSSASPERFEVVVIGGGQAGLATGYHLAKRDLRFVILDTHDRVGDAWRNRWDSLRLFTPAMVSGLPGMRFPAPRYQFPTKDQVADYLEQYAETMHLPVRSGTEASKVASDGAGLWLVETSGGSILTEQIVIATGGYQAPNIPPWSADLDPAIRQLHSKDYRNPSQLNDGAVLVVGASHSGAEIAIEVARNHPTVLAGRDTGQIPVKTEGRIVPFITPLIWFTMNHIVTVDTPIGRKGKAKFRNHGFPLEHPNRADIAAAGVDRITARVTGARGGKPVLADGRELDVHNIVWCTGFHGDYSWIEGVTYGDDGYPDQHHGAVAGSDGLYFVGLKFQRAAASSLVGGVGRDAADIAGQIAATVRRTN